MKIDEWVVFRGILIVTRREFERIGLAEHAVAAGAALARGVLAHVLHVALPGETRRLELIRERPHRARIDAAPPERLPVLIDAGLCGGEIGVAQAVALRVLVRSLA